MFLRAAGYVGRVVARGVEGRLRLRMNVML